MRFFPVLWLGLLFGSLTGWETDFENAKKHASSDHKLILVNFSGSDWCGPCIRLHDDIFENKAFKLYADSNLVLVNADFPRLKKNQLPKEQQKKNEKLADKYNPEGIFPLTLLTNADGKVLRKWEGLPDLSATQFIQEINDLANARN